VCLSAFRAGASLSESLPQDLGEAHPEHSHLYAFPAFCLSTLFNPKSIELLTGSGQALVYYINGGDKFASGASEKKITATMLNVHLCGPLHLYGLFTCIGPFRFFMAVLHLYLAF